MNRYYEQVRVDVLEHVPIAASSILSVGCGAGLTERALVQRGASVVGIELNPEAAAAARRNGLQVVEGDAIALKGQLATRTFDCIVYADVLEHIADPEAVLAEHVPLLRPGGIVIVSTPNFRHYEVLRQLAIQGCVRYDDAGILDRTHLRMTTRKLVEGWLRGVSLRIVQSEYRMSRRREKLLAAASGGLLREFVARQVILVAEKA